MKMFILGVVVMSAFSTAALFAIDNSRDTLASILAGPCSWVLLGVSFITHHVKYWFKYHNVRTLVTDGNEIFYLPLNTNEDEFLEKHDNFNFAIWDNFAEKEHWDYKDWNKDFVWCEQGNIRYAPKSVWKRYTEYKDNFI